MDTDCGTLVGTSDDVKPTLKNPRDDDSNSDIDDGRDGAELLAAAEEGRGEDVLSILWKNPSLIRTGDPVGNTVLHMAARDGDIVTVCNLIAFLKERHNEDLKEVLRDVNVDGDTALHLALKNGHWEVAYHLITANNDRITPYGLAKKAGFSGLCERFVYLYSCESYDVDARMEQVRRDLMSWSRSIHVQWTKLKKAIEVGEEDVFISGLRKNSRELLWQKDHYGNTLLHAAATTFGMGPLSKLVQFMISNGLTDAAVLGNKDGDTALHFATENKDLTKAICLIEAKPSTVYQVNHKGVSPLYLAVKYGHEDLVKLMVTQSCLPPWESEMRLHPKHATLAHLAIKERSLGTLDILMEHLPELVKGTNEKGWRPLSYAANKGYLNEVTYLLTHFPKSAEEGDEDGSFPIHTAIGGGHVSIIKAFYKHCPQTFYQIDHKGRNVLQIAVKYKRADIVTYLTKELKWDDSFSNVKDNEGKTFMVYTFIFCLMLFISCYVLE
ncbi:hypothetical protein RND81_04G224000 [Saponaria officinalis]|uniref:Uncharacterized protein n=1 Tax=Saponaria officinalis TaxID=3572 RepID=A0AAW1LH45_SAPOF